MAQDNVPNTESWGEYRKLVLATLTEVKTDLKEFEKRISGLEKYADIQEDFKKLRSDFDKFLIQYQKEMIPIQTKQALLFSGLGGAITLGATYLIKLFTG